MLSFDLEPCPSNAFQGDFTAHYIHILSKMDEFRFKCAIKCATKSAEIKKNRRGVVGGVGGTRTCAGGTTMESYRLV